MPAWSSVAPAELPKAWLGAQGVGLGFGLGLRMALLAGLMQMPAEVRWLPAWLLLAHEAGTLCGVGLGLLARQRWQWQAGCSLWLLALLCLLFGAQQASNWQLAAMALSSSLLLALLTPALGQGLYDYVERRHAGPAIRTLLSLQALLQGLAPLVATWTLQQQGPRAYFWTMALMLAAAAWALRRLPPARTASALAAASDRPQALPRQLAWMLGLQLLELVLVSAFFTHLTQQAIAAGWRASELALAFAMVPLGCLLGGWLPLPTRSSGQWRLFLVAVLALPLLLRLAYAGLPIGQQTAMAVLLLLAGLAMGAESLAATALRLRLLAAEQAVLWQRGGLGLSALLSAAGIGLAMLL